MANINALPYYYFRDPTPADFKQKSPQEIINALNNHLSREPLTPDCAPNP